MISSLLLITTVILIVLKVVGTISWHWLLVLSPTLFPLIITTILKAIGMKFNAGSDYAERY